MSTGAVHMALDVGSVAVKAAMMADDGTPVGRIVRPIAGMLVDCLVSVLEEARDIAGDRECRLVGVTGSRGESFGTSLRIPSVSTIAAAYAGVGRIDPGVGAILELGGEHSSFLLLGPAPPGQAGRLERVETNGSCSAGTGAFLEQEAHRLGLSLPELGELALRSNHTVRIAGRCAVFAKTDLVHKHQSGVPVEDLAYALCHGIARSITSELIGSEVFRRPMALIGGVASNPGIQRALRETLGLGPDELLVPPSPALVGAVGALTVVMDGRAHRGIAVSHALNRLTKSRPQPAAATLHPLSGEASGRHRRNGTPTPPAPVRLPGEVIGIDIGSTSTNIAWLCADGTLKDSATTPTRGNPLAAAVLLLQSMEEKHGPVAPAAIGVTGSGRLLVSRMIGADFVVNEITAHAAGCAHYFPDADTVFDIGGQDSKFIRLDGRAVVGFEMNKVCSAGTGSFLEEMSTLLGLDIRGEFEREALRSEAPIDLGERCTVFMASEVARHLQEGRSREDLAAGLAYSVARNYLTRVVGRNPVGSRVVFQGGVAANRAVVETLEKVLGADVAVHPQHEIAGAIGVALLAGGAAAGPSRFRGADSLRDAGIRTKSFTCPKCDNQCTVHVTRAPTKEKFFSGALCDRYEARGAGDGPDERLDLFEERDRLIARWMHDVPAGTDGAIGIPRALLFHEHLPFWAAFFDELGIPYVLSPETRIATVEAGRNYARHGTCVPLATAYGHVSDLAKAGARRIFVPSVASLSDATVPERLSHACPSVQGWPYTTRTLVDGDFEVLAPRLRLGIPHMADGDLAAFAATLGATAYEAKQAIEAGRSAIATFRDQMIRRGDEVLAASREWPLAVLLARSYTMGDPQVRHRLVRVLDDVGLTAVPMDMVRSEPLHSRDVQGMFWYYGKRMLQVARSIREIDGVAAISISNFGCGPDSFILHMLRREIGEVPLLELEVDEHNAFNGVHTRVEAFKWSLKSRRRAAPRPPRPPGRIGRGELEERRLFIPWMSDHAWAFEAAFRAFGVDAEVLPEPGEESIALGKAALDGGECVPCAFLLGDMLRQCQLPVNGHPSPAFFMIGGDGPCRLGQYPWLYRAVLDDRGLTDVPIFNASQDTDFYEKFGMLSNEFRRLVWQGIVAIDLLFRKWRELRVRAVDPDEVDLAYRGQLEALRRSIERRESVTNALTEAFSALERTPGITKAPVARIGFLGENYIRCNATSNGRLAEALERMGLEVWYPSLCEWVLYTNWTARLHCRYEKQAAQWARLRMVDAVQRYDMARITRAVRGRLGNVHYPSVRRLQQLASPYIPRTLEGETTLGIGRTVDFHHQGLDGVVHVSPFNCMVGRIVEALCRRVSDDLDHFPVLHLEYDGRPGENLNGRLESFVMQARGWNSSRVVPGGPSGP